MSKYIKEQINIVFNRQATDADLEMLDKVFNDLRPEILDMGICPDEKTVDIQIDGDTSIWYNSLDIMNELHNTNPDVESVLIVDADCSFGSYAYWKTDKTSNENANKLMESFIESVKESIDESTSSINWC